jgi:ornithine--oxo-acid transaminase
MMKQAQTLTLTSRAFHNDSVFEEYVTKYFGFDKVLPMNTGAEAVETAIKNSKENGDTSKRYPK